MTNIMSEVPENRCCGCGSCAVKCPVGAISMQENVEGFLYPVIDEEKCIHCGVCSKACPILNKRQNNESNPICYAVMADDELRAKSSSGGMFTLLSQSILNKNGYVCGATFRDDWTVHHIIIDSENDLHKLRGSKYIQSDLENCFEQIKQLLNGKKEVLFSGTPCQIAGLYAFLGKEYDNLLTVDVFCHGVPSVGVWRKYLAETFQKNTIKNVNFRDKKEIGWSCSHCTITLDDGKKVVSNDYTKLFHNSTILRKSCEDCPFSQLPRKADISLGDWWGISQYVPGLNDGKGLSLVLLNNEKGERIFNALNIAEDRKRMIELKSDYNNGHMRFGLKLNPKRERFFKDIQQYSYHKSMKMTEDKYDVCLLSIFYGLNYGSILVSYACNKLISNLGYSVLMLDKPSFVWSTSEIGRTIPNEFAKKYYNISSVYNSLSDLISLNNQCHTFVSGSDQIFRPGLKLDFTFQEFVQNSKNKIIFGSSFGVDDYRSTPEDIERKRLLFRRFNHIALREKSEKLCHEIFDFEAEEIIDPTLILPRAEFDKLADSVQMNLDKPYLLTYMLDLNIEKVKAVQYIAEKLNLQIINIQNLDKRQRKDLGLIYDKDYTPEEFLHLYKNASFVVTDSYHGTCFSTKFNKQFISFMNIGRGKLRYKLFTALGLNERIFENVNDIYDNPIIYNQFDFEKTNQLIAEKSVFAINWLKNALENNTPICSDVENYMDVVVKELSTQLSQLKAGLGNITEQNLQNYIRLIENNRNEIRDYKLLASKDKTLSDYHRYKVLYKLLWGKKRKKYKQKYKDLKPRVKQIRRLLRSEI